MSLIGQSEQQLQYNPVAIGDIDSTLFSMFSSPDDPDVRYVRIGSTNLIMVCSCSCSGCQQASLVNSLSLVRPGRFFVVCLKDGGDEITAQLSARCTKFNEQEHLCSEVIRLEVPKAKVNALPSVIWANTLTGMPTELFWNRISVSSDIIDLFLPHTSRIVVDSSCLDDAAVFLRWLMKKGKSLSGTVEFVDLQWLRLLGWRDALARFFTASFWDEVFSGLSRIEIFGSSRESEAGIGLPVLFVGQILSSLGCRNWCFEKKAFQCARGDGGSVIVDFIDYFDSPGIEEIGLRLVSKQDKSVTVIVKDNILRVDLVSDGQVDSRECKLERSLPERLLERYYLYGQETTGYPEALLVALELVRFCN